MTMDYYGILAPEEISIHIPRVGDDISVGADTVQDKNFNPHPPCGG